MRMPSRTRPARIAVAATASLFALGLASAPSALSLEEPKAGHPSELFLKHCAECHGADGKAQTEQGKKLKAEVFADKGWREKKRSKADKLVNSVLNGHGKKMPSFKDKVSPEEAKSLVEKDVLGDWK